MILAALYQRVSTEDQAERQTIRTQDEFGRRYLDLHSIPLIDSYPDEGVSGIVPFDQRPQGARLLADARSGRINTVYVYKLDRIGRDPRVILNALHQLRQAGCQMVSMTEAYETNTPSGNLLIGVLATVAGFERETIAARTSAGRYRKAREGVIPSGLGMLDSLFGYRRAEGGLTIYEPEAAVVRELFTRALAGVGLPTLAKELNARGITTQRGATWTRGQVHRVLTQPAYAGTWYYGMRSHVRTEEPGKPKTETRRRPVEAWVPIPVPAVVSLEVWEQVQVRLEQTRARFVGRPTTNWLLHGLLECSDCRGKNGAPIRCHGLRISRNRKRPGYHDRYYRCNSQNNDLLPFCGLYVRADEVEAKAYAELEAWLRPGALAAEARRQAEARRPVDAGAEREMAERTLAGLDREEDRLLALRLEGFSQERIAARLEPLRRQRETLQATLRELAVREAETPDADEAAARAEAWAERARRTATPENPAGLQQAYQDLFRIVLYPDKRPPLFQIQALSLPARGGEE